VTLINTLKPRERERDRKDRRRVDAKRKSRGEVRDSIFQRGRKSIIFRRFPGFDLLSF
jgi:hypothetical protein